MPNRLRKLVRLDCPGLGLGPTEDSRRGTAGNMGIPISPGQTSLRSFGNRLGLGPRYWRYRHWRTSTKDTRLYADSGDKTGIGTSTLTTMATKTTETTRPTGGGGGLGGNGDSGTRQHGTRRTLYNGVTERVANP